MWMANIEVMCYGNMWRDLIFNHPSIPKNFTIRLLGDTNLDLGFFSTFFSISN